MVAIQHNHKTVKKILELWGKGLTGKQIGEKLGMTRSAVLGKVGRLRKLGLLEYRDPAQKKNISSKERAQRKSYPFVKSNKRKTLPPLPPVEDGLRPLSLMELKATSCRFVINDSKKPSDFLFCGKPKKTGSYCEDHHSICYIKSEPRKRDKPRKAFQLNPRYSEAK